jgi:hypothetical protein
VDHRATRIAATRLLATAIAAALGVACASPPPPAAPAPTPVAALELARVGRVGVLHFSAVGETALEPRARRDFLAAVRAAQPEAVLVDLGAAGGRLDASAIRAIGHRHGVDAVLVGELWADTIDPVEFMQRARARTGPVEIEGTLSARLYDARDGAEIWSTSALGSQPITRVRVDAWGSKSVDAKHLDEVRSRLVESLVAQSTADFRRGTTAPLAGGAAPAPSPAPAKAAGRD